MPESAVPESSATDKPDVDAFPSGVEPRDHKGARRRMEAQDGWFAPPVVVPILVLLAVLARWYWRLSA